MLWAAVLGLKERVWITTAFFAPRRALVDALCDAAAGGRPHPLLVDLTRTSRLCVRQATAPMRRIVRSGCGSSSISKPSCTSR